MTDLIKFEELFNGPEYEKRGRQFMNSLQRDLTTLYQILDNSDFGVLMRDPSEQIAYFTELRDLVTRENLADSMQVVADIDELIEQIDTNTQFEVTLEILSVTDTLEEGERQWRSYAAFFEVICKYINQYSAQFVGKVSVSQRRILDGKCLISISFNLAFSESLYQIPRDDLFFILNTAQSYIDFSLEQNSCTFNISEL